MRYRYKYLGGLALAVLIIVVGVLLFRPRVLPSPGPGASPAAASPSLSGWPRVFADALGHTITLEHPVRRLVTMSPNLAEIVCAVGAGDRLVGVDDFTKYPPEAAAKPKIGGIINPSLESMLAIQPQIVLVACGVDRYVLRRLQEIGGLQVLLYDPQTLEEVLDTINQIGLMCGKESQAAQVVQALRARKQAVDRQVAARGTARPRALLVIAWEGLFVAGASGFGNDLLETAGGVNLVKHMSGIPANQPWPQVTRELVVLADPQVLVFAGKHAVPVAGQREAILEWLRQDPAWKNLSAVRTGTVVIVEEDLVTVPSPRLFDGLEAVADAIRLVPAPGASAP